jgi:nitrogen fixation-related uncharacterized protein
MTEILHQLYLSPESALDGLVAVHEKQFADISLTEQRVLHETRKISKDIDFVFFRRFPEGDVRTSEPMVYIIDNTSGKLSNKKLARLHHALWLNGTVPLLYVDNADSVDILSCVAGPAAEKAKDWPYSPLDKICKGDKNISGQIKRFSASALADGTFWKNKSNKNYVDRKNSAHNILFEKIKQANKEIGGSTDPLAQRFLIQTIFVKYLEDRGLFKVWVGFFHKYAAGANSFYEVLRNGTVESIEELFKCLGSRLGVDVFMLKEKNRRLTRKLINKIVDAVQAYAERKGVFYFWGIYNFAYIPIEVISYACQCFTKRKKGTGITPVLLVDLMLDQVMALEDLNGGEKIFDPAFGSGLFLVSAFRRLIFVNQQRKNRSLDAHELVELLHTTVYGVELRKEDAETACFCLALAVCDALTPELIGENLIFRNMIESNIFIGETGKRCKDALAACNAHKSKKGFDIIVGHPPFTGSQSRRIAIKAPKKAGKNMPAKQLAYHVLINCVRHLCDTGKLCMVQHCNFLYNSDAASVPSDFFDRYTVNKILDFVSISEFFGDENTKAAVIQLEKKRPRDKNKLMHLTLRGTVSANERVCFEMDHYDYHYVSQKEVANEEIIWKANLLGGGRLNQLARHLKAIPTINDFIKSNKWHVQGGLKTAKTIKKTKQVDWLHNKPILTPGAVSGRQINKRLLGSTDTVSIKQPKTEFTFLPPLLIISKFNPLEAVFWDEGFLAYTDEFVGIMAPGNDQKKDLEIFFESFTENIETLQACLLLLGSETLGEAVHTKDILSLPWPPNGNFDLLPWETELLADVRNCMADYTRLGQTSKLFQNRATDDDLENYSQTFLRLMNKSYPNMRMRKYVKNTNLVFMFFSFSEKDDPLPEIDGCNRRQLLQSIGSNEHAKSLQSLHVTRIFTGNTLIIVKPDNLRYWIRSTAVRDVDDTIMDIFLKKK